MFKTICYVWELTATIVRDRKAGRKKLICFPSQVKLNKYIFESDLFRIQGLLANLFKCEEALLHGMIFPFTQPLQYFPCLLCSVMHMLTCKNQFETQLHVHMAEKWMYSRRRKSGFMINWGQIPIIFNITESDSRKN